MSAIWFVFASLIVIGAQMYNFGIKLGGERMNPFLFTTILTAVALALHLTCLVVYKIGFSQNTRLQYDGAGIWYAVLAGVAVVIIDLFFFLGVREGGLIPTQTFWTVGGIIAMAILAWLFLGENFNLQKATGIVLGAAGLYLIIRS